MNRSIKAIITLLIMMSTSAGVAQSAGPIEELKACARLTDRDVRLACFDELGERVLREETAENKPARKEVTQSEAVSKKSEENVQPLPDDLGISKIGDDQESTSVKYSGMVQSCKKGHYGDWYFILDNGQVWKDVGDSRLYFKECNFNVTISEDFFGYKMSIESLDKTIPIRRHQ